MKIPEIPKEIPHYISRKERGVRKTLLMGVFWRILVIEAILLIGEETYRLAHDFVTTDPPRSVMMKGLKSPLVYYAVTAIGPPHDADLIRRPVSEGGVEIHLPFHYWKVDGKSVVGEPLHSETSIFKENLITAAISPPLEPMTDIKLIFDFCQEAHCFEDIYAKVMPVGEDKQKLPIRKSSRWITCPNP